MINKIRSLLLEKESLTLEFKESKTKLNKDIYDTVCSFSNRQGGYIILGISDNNKIIGISRDKIEQLKSDFITTINNTQKLNPPLYLQLEEMIINDKILLYVYIPQSSQVHRLNGKIFDRNGDSDLDITNHTNLVASMYIQKYNYFSENKVFHHITINDLDKKLFNRVRIMAKNNNNGSHIWETMTDIEILKSSGLYIKDMETLKEGVTLAAILLFGTNQAIQNAIPFFRIDAILRKEDLDRYDDREDIRTNLFDSFDRLMAFVDKHINDPFYMEGTLRISARTKIFREAVVNMLIHREYSDLFVSKMIIYKDKVILENGNKVKEIKEITENNYTPFPKNPIIAKVFREVGLAEELGSGMRNIFKYFQVYSNIYPKIIEEKVFRTNIMLNNFKANDQASDQASDQANDQASDQASDQAILEFCNKERTSLEIMNFLKMKHKTYFRNNILKPLIDKGLIGLTIPDKPKSPKQKYKKVI